MSQGIWSSINPFQTSGLMLAGLLDDFKDAIMTGFSGSSRPSNLQAGGSWIDTTFQAAPNYYWSYKIFDGATDTEVFRISILNGFGGTLVADATFTIQEISADAVGPILNLVKNRIVNNGQVLNGDTVAEIRFTGRTNTSTDPLVAYLKFTATDDMTTSAYGGTFSLYSTKDASTALSEHLRFISGFVETVVPHKLNSQILVGQNVATAATIAQLSASKILVEMTGATATDIQGVDSSTGKNRIIIHNRSTATVTLKHENAGATASDRLKLPFSSDFLILPQTTAQFFYCSTDLRWKLLSATAKKLAKTIEKLNGVYQNWVAPLNCTKVRVVGYSNPHAKFAVGKVIDPYGNMYAWGINPYGNIGDGTVVSKSSPVAVLGGLVFSSFFESLPLLNSLCYALTNTGAAYAWGDNIYGGIGDGTVLAKSSPIAVLGGLKFSAGWCANSFALAATSNGTLYTWGTNINGNLGLGDVVPRSSPVAVLGGLKFSSITVSESGYGGGSAYVVGITPSGDAYSWGFNTNGELGVGDRTPRSSPVAVLGGLKWKKIIANGNTIGLTSDGTLYAWGINSSGQLGVGDTVKRSSPVAVLNGTGFIDIIRAGPQIFAVKADGTLYAWGNNTYGQLGLGDVTFRSSPVAVLGGLKFKDLVGCAAANAFVIGLADDGSLYSWGNNDTGFLGLGDTTKRSSPVLISSTIKWAGLCATRAGTFASKVDGSMWGWGLNNDQGDLGVGDIADKTSPTLMSTGHGVIPQQQICEVEITVTPTSSYEIYLSALESKFGDVSLGYGVDNITIEYEI